MNNERFNDCDLLVDRFLAGDLSEEESDVLLNWLKENPANREFFRLNVLTDFLLKKQSERLRENRTNATGVSTEFNPLIVAAARNQKTRAKSRLAKPIALIKRCFWPSKYDWEESVAPVFTLLILLFAAFYIPFSVYMVYKHGAVEEPITTIARVNEVLDVVWANGSPEYKPGQLVDQSEFRFSQGLLQLEMNNGTTLVVVGPAELTITSAMDAFCHSGQVSVNVSPSAIGYKLVTPFGNVVDQGTEFFVNVSPKDTKVDVVKGKVDFLDKDGKIAPMVTNQTIVATATQQVRGVANPAQRSYIDKKQLKARVRTAAEKELSNKEQIGSTIVFNPDLKVRFDFANMSRRKVVNESIPGREITSKAIARSIKKTRGRISNTKSIKIQEPNSIVRAEIPETFESMTIDMMVRILWLKGEGNLLFASEPKYDGRRDFQVQIQHDGRIQVRLLNREGEFEYYETDVVVDHRVLGTWTRFTFVLDRSNRQIRFYMDNRQVANRHWKNPNPIYLGDSTIGNTIPEEGTLANHAMNGSLVGFTLWQRPLTKGEIEKFTLD